MKKFLLTTELVKRRSIQDSMKFKVITEIYYIIVEDDPEYCPEYWSSSELVPDNIPVKLWYRDKFL